ncbi:PAS domain S-box protein [Savagea sp. SN6]|uniref:histidine kinase n=1 Tax=Savagea serpentis TaxID=2785297 RepID=A0A8J7G5G2_9BACL|nr:ATP-binding protein [Savagea serpentis]MBF4501702.1 PAS domain S-box protein [Savagea serpentis]
MRQTIYSKLVVAVMTVLFVMMTLAAIVFSQFFYLFEQQVDVAIQQKYWSFIVIVTTLLFFTTGLILVRVIYAYTKSVETVTRTAEQLTSGNYLARVPMTDVTDDRLSIAMNQIASNLQELQILREMDQERTKTLVESIGSGLLMFGREGNLNMVNGVFEKQFGYKRRDILGKQFYSIGLPDEVEEVIEEVFLTEATFDQQMTVRRGEERLHLSVYGAPVIGMHGNWLGIIIVFHNITELVRLEEIRKDFVANVSHELRTPVTSIKGFTETILDGAIESREVTIQFLEIIQKESDRLQLLIDDLLELSRIERTEFQLQMKYVQIGDVVRDAIAITENQRLDKRIDLEVEGNDQAVVEADDRRLIQIFVNLLTNAISYSKPETCIHVSYGTVDEEVFVSIQDEGIGIAPEEKNRLFERFYRVDKARARDSGGTGLGLAIVKHLVEAHKGRIEVESEVDQGTTFTIYLPPRQSNRKELKTV